MSGRGKLKVGVRPNRLATIVAAAFAMASVAAVAHAAPSDLFSQHDDFTPQPNQIGPQAPHKALQWNNKTGRWGVNLDMAQPSDRDPTWRDARIGLNYGVAPGVRTGRPQTDHRRPRSARSSGNHLQVLGFRDRLPRSGDLDEQSHISMSSRRAAKPTRPGSVSPAATSRSRIGAAARLVRDDMGRRASTAATPAAPV
jgi:hypothetical protein